MENVVLIQQRARLRVWQDDPANSADTIQRVMLDFCRAPTVIDDYRGFSKLIARPTYICMRKFACVFPEAVPLNYGEWPNLRQLIFYVTDSAEPHSGHYVLRTYFDACDAVLFWLDSAPEYLPIPIV